MKTTTSIGTIIPIQTSIQKLKKTVVVFWILFFLAFGFSKAQAAERHIAVVTRPGWSGELEFACRIQKAATNINWIVDIVDFRDTTIDHIKYDFVICLIPDAYRSSHTTYLTLFDPKNHFFKETGSLKKEYSSYDGYLVTYKLDPSKRSFDSISKHAWMPWYPSAQIVPHEKIDPKFLFYVCANWSQRSHDPRYKVLLSLLDRKPYTRLYGLEHFKTLYPRSYISFIPVDGESMLQEIQKSGIALVLHSLDHLDNAIPSGRIFEAVASSSVVICDNNPFVKEHFGSSVLYIEQNTTGPDMFQQIDKHMNWILSHKEEAMAMAQKAHEIYIEKFTLENQLLELEELHNNIVKK